jgi:hypothetical protein
LSQNHRLDCQLHPLKTQPLARRPQVGRVRADFVDSLASGGEWFVDKFLLRERRFMQN